MTFTLEKVVDSIARLLTSQYPEYPVYSSQNQQGSRFPCFFVFFMPSKNEDGIGNRCLRDLGVDIVFVQQRNTVNGNAELMRIADFLDANTGLIPYSGAGGVKIPTYEKEWQVEDGELHYQFRIKERVAFPKESNPMKRMEENYAGIKESG